MSQGIEFLTSAGSNGTAPDPSTPFRPRAGEQAEFRAGAAGLHPGAEAGPGERQQDAGRRPARALQRRHLALQPPPGQGAHGDARGGAF